MMDILFHDFARKFFIPTYLTRNWVNFDPPDLKHLYLPAKIWQNTFFELVQILVVCRQFFRHLFLKVNRVYCLDTPSLIADAVVDRIVNWKPRTHGK